MAETIIGEIGDVVLERGGTLKSARLAYAVEGTLNADKSNVVLLTHGYTSSHQMMGSANSEGSWSGLVGPGRAIDADRFFVVSSNMLGSSYGSTAPMTINPETGRHYGPDFPEITLKDIVTAQKQLLESLGIKHLVTVAGSSYGGFQAFAWAGYYPDWMDAIIAAVSGPKSPSDANRDLLLARFQKDPNWNGGHYYTAGGVGATMTAIREETLRRYGAEEELAGLGSKAAIAAEITKRAQAWAGAFDAHSLMVLGRAASLLDATPLIPNFKAKVLYVLSRTDLLFPPSLAPGLMAQFAAAGVDAQYFEIDSDHGHLAAGTDAAKWAPTLKAFMATL